MLLPDFDGVEVGFLVMKIEWVGWQVIYSRDIPPLSRNDVTSRLCWGSLNWECCGSRRVWTRIVDWRRGWGRFQTGIEDPEGYEDGSETDNEVEVEVDLEGDKEDSDAEVEIEVETDLEGDKDDSEAEAEIVFETDLEGEKTITKPILRLKWTMWLSWMETWL